jgi:hypothetical protein
MIFTNMFFESKKKFVFKQQMYVQCDVWKLVVVTSSYARNVLFQLKKHFSFSVARARHDDKFVTRLTSATRIVWFTELDDKSIAFFSLSNSSSYMRKNSSKEIWAESEAIDRDVWRFQFADV